jgi:hypothetical protein
MVFHCLFQVGRRLVSSVAVGPAFEVLVDVADVLQMGFADQRGGIPEGTQEFDECGVLARERNPVVPYAVQ